MNPLAPLLFVLVLTTFGCGRGSRHSTDSGQPSSPQRLAVHPVFHTRVTGASANRPAVQVEVLNENGNRWFSTAKLYLTVQSSRFPDNVWIVLPVNVGDFSGCKARFVQLPFEIEVGQTVVFNLLDDVQLTSQDEERVLAACRTAGFCISIAGSVYAPDVGPLIAPVVDDAAKLLGETYIESVNFQKFQNIGAAEFIAPAQIPAQPHEANRLTLLDSSGYAYMQLRLYGPQSSLNLHATTNGIGDL